jgi:crotonobetainyl-CoA:carnitine CoA-transferase CaiB-like acyl-CoA transferase
MNRGLLTGVRVVESCLLEPGTLGMLLASLGAEVIKVEAPDGGDYIRRTGWPFVNGESIMHWHCSRGKSSVVLDLTKEEGAEAYLDLVRNSHVVIEGMRPGALARRGLSFDRLRAANPSIVLCSLSGYGSVGPYRDMPSHGLGFDAWAGTAPPAVDELGRPHVQDMAPIGARVGPLYGAVGVLAALWRAKATGEPCQIDISQSEASAAVNWLVIEGQKAYERPEPHVTGNPSDGGRRRALGLVGMRDGVRYQYYASQDGFVLFMASERHFWEKFCRALDRVDLFEANPGARYADHAIGNDELRATLAAIFAQRTTQDWVRLGIEQDIPIAPVNDSRSILTDPHFAATVDWLPESEYGADLLPPPIRLVGEELPATSRAPAYGEHTDAVLERVLGYSGERIAELRHRGALGATTPAASTSE